MRFHQKLLAAVSFGLLALTASVGASASPANPQVGSDYRVLEQAQPTDSGNKVEVIEFFWYDCPHCAAWDPSLTAWVKKQGDKINFKKVPVAFRDTFVPQQKLYYTLEAMGKAEELTPKIFRAIHVDGERINTDKTILAYIEKIGLDKQKFLDLYNSFRHPDQGPPRRPVAGSLQGRWRADDRHRWSLRDFAGRGRRGPGQPAGIDAASRRLAGDGSPRCQGRSREGRWQHCR